MSNIKLVEAGKATRFKKGQSGNPAGSRIDWKKRLLTRLELLIDSDETPHMARVRYLTVYLDLRGFKRASIRGQVPELPDDEPISLADFKLPPRK